MKHPLNAKLMNDKIKQGWTTAVFAALLGISNEQFMSVLEKEFSRNAYEGFRSSLKKNDKYQKRITKNVAQSLSQISEEPSENLVEEIPTEYHEEVNENALIEDIIDSDSEISTENQESEENISSDNENINNIEELEIKLKQATKFLNDSELKHKDLTSERISIRKEIVGYQEELKQMREKVAKIQESIGSLKTRFDTIGKEMLEITSQIRDTKIDIAQYTTQLEEAKKVLIYICDSGELVVESKMEFEIENWELLCYNTIVKENELKSLTIIQAEALAKAILLVRFLIVQEVPYEVVFDNPIAETYFKKVIS